MNPSRSWISAISSIENVRHASASTAVLSAPRMWLRSAWNANSENIAPAQNHCIDENHVGTVLPVSRLKRLVRFVPGVVTDG